MVVVDMEVGGVAGTTLISENRPSSIGKPRAARGRDAQSVCQEIQHIIYEQISYTRAPLLYSVCYSNTHLKPSGMILAIARFTSTGCVLTFKTPPSWNRGMNSPLLDNLKTSSPSPTRSKYMSTTTTSTDPVPFFSSHNLHSAFSIFDHFKEKYSRSSGKGHSQTKRVTEFILVEVMDERIVKMSK